MEVPCLWGGYLHRTHTACRVGTDCGEEGIPWFLGYSMLMYCPHSEAAMTVAGTLSPFDRVEVTVMAVGSQERDMGDTVRGHSAASAMVIPFAAWKHMHFTVE